MNNFIFSCLCLILFYAPIPLGANRIWASSSIEFAIFLLFVVHIFYSIKHQRVLIPLRIAWPVLIPLVAVCGWLSLQLAANLTFDPSLTHIMLLKSLALTLFAVLVFCYVDTSKRVFSFAVVVVLCGLYQAMYATWLNLNPGMLSPVFNVPYTDRAQGTFMYQNQLANYLALTLSIGIGLLVSELSLSRDGDRRSKRLRHRARDFVALMLSPKIVIRLSLIIMIIGLILTRSRMGNSAFFMALALVSLFALFFYNRPPRSLRWLIVSFFVLDLILIGSIFGVEKVKQRLVETSLQSETRDEVVRDALPMIADHPIFGTGGGSFYSSFPSYHPEVYSGFYDHAHNDYIQFAVELGLPITLLLGLMMLYCLWLAFKVMVKRKTPLYQGIAFGCAIAIIHMILHSTVDFSLQSPAIALMFISILSLVIVVAKLPRVTDKSR